MTTDPARAARDEAAVAEYRRLRDAGDRRILHRSVDGELVLYRPDELGFRRSGPANTIRTRRGAVALAVGAGILCAVCLIAGAMVAAAGGPGAAIAVPGLLFGAVAAWTAILAARERRAEGVRASRGVPEPSTGPGS